MSDPNDLNDKADLQAWATHMRDAHGEAALEETLGVAIDEYIEKLKLEGKVLHNPFTSRDLYVEDPPAGHE